MERERKEGWKEKRQSGTKEVGVKKERGRETVSKGEIAKSKEEKR